MHTTAKTPTREITVSAVNLSVPQPFTEGHVLTEMESKVLNQTLAENLRNNFAGTVKKATEAAEKAKQPLDVAALQKAMSKYVEGYEFGVRRSGVSLDPVEREAMALATERVKEALKAKGHKIADVGKEKIAELASQAIDKNPSFMEQAKRVVAERAKIGSEGLDLTL
jgi:hypothetical protein